MYASILTRGAYDVLPGYLSIIVKYDAEIMKVPWFIPEEVIMFASANCNCDTLFGRK
jgi:hypothetical protein